MRLISVLFLVFFLQSCSSNPSIKLKSYPDGAKVSAVQDDGSTQVIGVTPLESSGSMQSLIIEKEGFESARIFVGRLQTQHYEYMVKLTPRAEDPKMNDLKSRYEKLAKSVAKANHLINQKRYSEAESLLTNLTNDYPNVSVGYDLLGNISYLQKDFRRAINHYQRSLELNPENSETKQVLDRLRSMIN